MSGIQMVVQYSDHHLDTGPLFKWHLNAGPFSVQTTFKPSNTRLVQYSDPHSIQMVESCLIVKCWGIRISSEYQTKIGQNDTQNKILIICFNTNTGQVRFFKRKIDCAIFGHLSPF